jgi:hypothetical protein
MVFANTLSLHVCDVGNYLFQVFSLQKHIFPSVRTDQGKNGQAAIAKLLW